MQYLKIGFETLTKEILSENEIEDLKNLLQNTIDLYFVDKYYQLIGKSNYNIEISNRKCTPDKKYVVGNLYKDNDRYLLLADIFSNKDGSLHLSFNVSVFEKDSKVLTIDGINISINTTFGMRWSNEHGLENYCFGDGTNRPDIEFVKSISEEDLIKFFQAKNYTLNFVDYEKDK